MCHCILLRPGGFNGSYPFITPTLPYLSSLLLTLLLASFKTVQEDEASLNWVVASNYCIQAVRCWSFRNKASHSLSLLFLWNCTKYVKFNTVVLLILHSKWRVVSYCTMWLSSARLKSWQTRLWHFKVVMADMLAENCLLTHSADTEQHQHSFGVVLVSTWWLLVQYSLSFQLWFGLLPFLRKIPGS